METSQEYQVDLNWKENQNAKISAVIFNNAIEVAPYSCLEKLNEMYGLLSICLLPL
jgi:hypothetical protein